MDRKTRHIFISSVFISLLLCGTAFSVCYEAAEGRLQPGSISEYISRILLSYEKDVPDGAVYTVQKTLGHYFKICNEPVQIDRFMEKWVYPDVGDGAWQLILTTKDRSGVQIVSELGVHKIKKENDIWKVWKYTKTKTEKPVEASKLEESARKKTERNSIVFREKGIEEMRQKAKKFSANPIPLCMEEKKLMILGKGTKFTSEMSKGETLTVDKEAFLLKDPSKLIFAAKDLICNICEDPVILKKIELKSGDCIHIREKMVVKKEKFISFQD